MNLAEQAQSDRRVEGGDPGVDRGERLAPTPGVDLALLLGRGRHAALLDEAGLGVDPRGGVDAAVDEVGLRHPGRRGHQYAGACAPFTIPTPSGLRLTPRAR